MVPVRAVESSLAIHKPLIYDSGQLQELSDAQFLHWLNDDDDDLENIMLIKINQAEKVNKHMM